MCCGLSGGVRDRKLCGVDGVAKLPPTCSPAARVTGDGVCRLAICKIGGHCDDLLCLDGEVDGIRDCKSAVGNTDRALAREGDFLQCVGLDLVDACCLVDGQSNRNGCDGQVRASKDVRDFDADL